MKALFCIALGFGLAAYLWNAQVKAYVHAAPGKVATQAKRVNVTVDGKAVR
jgi:hypothetical protein